MMQQYRQLAEEAVQAFHGGNHRLAADKYLKAVQVSAAPNDVWAQNRYHVLTGYTSILREKYFEPSREDLKALRKIGESATEPHVYRVEAMWTLGLLHWDRGDRHIAADNYNEALRLIDTASTEEKDTRIITRTATAPLGVTNVAYVLTDNRRTIEGNLSTLQGPFNPLPNPLNGVDHNHLRSDGSAMPAQAYISRVPTTQPELMSRLAVGGQKCDGCEISLVGPGAPAKKCCSRCRLMYYCSTDCQANAWRAGHKACCRKKNEIKKGDIMQLVEIKAKPELNGSLVEIMHPDTKKDDRWVTQPLVNITGGPSNSMSISTSKLRHIRPAK